MDTAKHILAMVVLLTVCMHIIVSEFSDNGLSPDRRQTII